MDDRLFQGKVPNKDCVELRRKCMREWDEICEDANVPPHKQRDFLVAMRREVAFRNVRIPKRVYDLLEAVEAVRRAEDQVRAAQERKFMHGKE